MKNILNLFLELSFPLVHLALCFAFINDSGQLGEFVPMTISSSIIFAFFHSVMALVKRYNGWKASTRNGGALVTNNGATLFENSAAALLGIAVLAYLHYRFGHGWPYYRAADVAVTALWALGGPAAVLYPWLMLALAPRYQPLRSQGYFVLCLFAAVVLLIIAVVVLPRMI